MNKLLATCLLALTLSACSDQGVVVGDGKNTSGSGVNSPGNSGGSGGGGVPVVEETGTGEPTTTLAASNLDPADVIAARFLNQTTFGATEESVENFKTFASKAAWIDHQQSLPVSLTLPFTQSFGNNSTRQSRHHVWWNNALYEPDQLRQRVAFALSQIFVVSDLDRALSNSQHGMSDYYDMLARNAFGNYRTLLEDVALHPVMGVYLSMVRNEKANAEKKIRPDENFAREVLQLFSIGLVELNERGEPTNPANPVPTYSQTTIEEFARVFTGWNYSNVRSWTDKSVTGDAWLNRMVPDESFHDTGAKTLLNNVVVPAGLSAADDMQAALNNIFQHRNVAPFISKQLIQRLVTSNPSPEYVERIAGVFNNNGGGVRGDLGAVVKAILLDDEAQQGKAVNPDFGKIREPNIRIAHYWRLLKATPGPKANGLHRTPGYSTDRLDNMGGQAVMKSPSVFNFYKPDHKLVPGKKLLAPEMQNMTEAFIAATHINYHHMVYRFNDRTNFDDDNPTVSFTDFRPLADMAANPEVLLDWYNLYFFSGSMPDKMRATIGAYMLDLPNDTNGRYARAQDSLFMVMVAPAIHIQD